MPVIEVAIDGGFHPNTIDAFQRSLEPVANVDINPLCNPISNFQSFGGMSAVGGLTLALAHSSLTVRSKGEERNVQKVHRNFDAMCEVTGVTTQRCPCPKCSLPRQLSANAYIPAPPSTRVFVSNLDYKTKWRILKQHMSQAGEVVRADILWNRWGRSQGCAIVEYKTFEAAKKAIQSLNASSLGPRNIFVREDREPRGFRLEQVTATSRSPDPTELNRGHTLYVGNLPYSSTWQDLKDLFAKFGPVIRAHVMVNADGTSKGFGTVQFENEKDSEKAIYALHQYILYSRPLVVRKWRYN
eukprot:177596_1